MTSSKNIGVPEGPRSAAQLFYDRQGIKDKEDKIKALERQLQEFPFHAMDRDVRLNQLEQKYNNMIAYQDQVAQDRKSDQKKFGDLYKKVNDTNNPKEGIESPIESMMRGRISIERDYE